LGWRRIGNEVSDVTLAGKRQVSGDVLCRAARGIRRQRSEHADGLRGQCAILHIFIGLRRLAGPILTEASRQVIKAFGEAIEVVQARKIVARPVG
jgi:hypothetical protein